MFSFVRQTIQQFQTTGAVLPSSPRLSRAICVALREAVRSGAPPLRVLEAGPGTGPVTTEILQLLRPDDQLWLCELNPQFVGILKRKLDSDPLWKVRAHQVHLIQGPVQELARIDPEAQAFDMIICGLPFTNFPPELVQEIFLAFCGLAKPGAPLTWFEYIAVRKLRMTLGGRGHRQRLQQVSQAINEYRRQSICGGSREAILGNVPPAWVHRVHLNSGGAPPGQAYS